MGLNHPTDLHAWQRWQESRHRLRRLRHVRRTPKEELVVLTTYAAEPRVLVVLDSCSPTSHASLVEPLRHLDLPFAVLSPWPLPQLVERPVLTTDAVGEPVPSALLGVRAVVSLGHYLPRGAVAHRWARSVGAATFVVQHGALTPYAPPLPPGSRLLAWNEADADYWKGRRPDIESEVVGSQLLWRAGTSPSSGAAPPASSLVYLGQGHGAELPRTRLVHAALTFCREHDASYRPHPSERDRLSLLTLSAYERAGITVDRASVPLSELTAPVVSVFSTGVLEAAARGREAWVDFPRPPAWLGEFWERCGMHRLGTSPTPAPALPAWEPAARIAAIVSAAAS